MTLNHSQDDLQAVWHSDAQDGAQDNDQDDALGDAQHDTEDDLRQDLQDDTQDNTQIVNQLSESLLISKPTHKVIFVGASQAFFLLLKLVWQVAWLCIPVLPHVLRVPVSNAV